MVTFENSRNARITDLRKELTDSAFLFGKNKVISIAFGRDKTSQVKPGLYKLNKYIKGQCALLFSDRDIYSLRETFNMFRSQDYARPGVVAAQTVIPSKNTPYSHFFRPFNRFVMDLGDYWSRPHSKICPHIGASIT